MSAVFTQSSIQYWLDVRSLRLFLRVNIPFHVRLIYTIIHSVLSQCSATPIIPLCQYSISYSPDSNNRPFSIELTFGYSDHSSVSIFPSMSAGYTPSSMQYWVNVRLLWLFLCVNILFHVRLIYTIMHSVLSQCSATPIIPLCQYSISCSSDSNLRPFSIELTFSYCDHSSVAIFPSMSAGYAQWLIQYWVDVCLLWLFLCVNIIFHVRLIDTIMHSVFSQCSATPIIPLCQYSISCSPDSNNRLF